MIVMDLLVVFYFGGLVWLFTRTINSTRRPEYCFNAHEPVVAPKRRGLRIVEFHKTLTH
jgi:hypothetical protein